MPATVDDLFGGEVDFADGVVFGVGQVEFIADQAGALGAVEGGLGEGAVVEAGGACADGVEVLAFEVGDDDAVMAGVGDEEPVAEACRPVILPG